MPSKLKNTMLLIILGAIIAFPSIRAWAQFFAGNKIENNTVRAGTLVLALDSPGDFSPEVAPDKSASRLISASTTWATDIDYRVKIDNASGTLCDFLDLEAGINAADPVFSGKLNDFSVLVDENILFPQNWNLVVSLDGDKKSLQGEICEFDLIFHAWQHGFGEDSGNGFYDKKTVKNSVKAGYWVIKPGDVIINEIMWMGSETSNDDQWIELKNTTGHDIDIGRWTLENVLFNNASVHIPANTVIPPRGYYLISRYHSMNPKSFLAVEQDQIHGNLYLDPSGNGDIKLRDDGSDLIDQAEGDNWPAGENVQVWQSMERNHVPGDGLDPGNWHTCIDAYTNGVQYWDLKDITYGTPKDRNSASLDLTHPKSGVTIKEITTNAERIPFIPQDPAGSNLTFEPSAPPSLPESDNNPEENNAEGQDLVIIEEMLEFPINVEIKDDSQTEDNRIVEIIE
jgi:hypothetical protein